MFQTHQTANWTSHVYQLAAPPRLRGRRPDLHLSVLGRFFSNGRFVYEQISPGYIVHVVESGGGVMEVDGVPYAVGAGDAFTFIPGCHYRYYDRPASPWRYTWFQLEGVLAERALAQAELSRAQPLLAGDVAARLEPLFQEIETAYQAARIPPTFACAAAWRLVDALAGCRGSPGRVVPHDLAASARYLMDRQYMTALSVEAVARQLAVSRATLFRKFRDKYRGSPKGYLDSIRISQAQRLLQQSRSSVKEIAAACGFENAHSFRRAFKKRCGLPPKLWQRR